MAVTAKQIADQLGISAAAVSLALNNRRGVSEKTRQLVLSTAEALGYDFSKIKFERQKSGTVALVAFNRRRIFATPFFADMLAGVEGTLRHAGFSFSLVNYSPFENTQQQIADIAEAQYDGKIFRFLCFPVFVTITEFPAKSFSGASGRPNKSVPKGTLFR